MFGSGFDFVKFIMFLLGGLSFFLFGLDMMSQSLKKAAGDELRKLLSGISRNPVKGFFSGGAVTTVLQSSSATTVMLVGFVQAGLMSFASTLPIILGANIGATVTTQLIAFKILDYSLFFVVAGFFLRFFSGNESMKSWGDALIGFGLLFYGMELMGYAVEPLRELPELRQVLENLSNPYTGILAGLVITAVIQSSNALTGIVMVLAAHGLIDFYQAVPVVLGSNIGTCATAVIAGAGSGRSAKRVALSHLLFKVSGVIILLPLLGFFIDFVSFSGEYAGMGVERQIANAHTFFNLFIGVFFLPFTKQFAMMIEKIFPDINEPDEEEILFLTYLDDTKIVTADVAVYLSRKEIARMASTVREMLIIAAMPFSGKYENEEDRRFPGRTLEQGVRLREREIDFLEKKISDYLFQAARENVSRDEQHRIYSMISIVKDLESIGDLIERNFLNLLEKKKALNIDFSAEGREELEIYHGKAVSQIALLKEAFDEKDLSKAAKIMTKERKYLDLELQYRVRHLERIVCKRAESIETHEVHMELMNILNQVIVYTSNIAKTFVSSP
ncbi:MAG: Na/Pi cotransporter family protein [Desulfobacteraceae bacterium]|nr:Na/Pi cotransporter family protein [Desulfobacteraceae bacterium]